MLEFPGDAYIQTATLPTSDPLLLYNTSFTICGWVNQFSGGGNYPRVIDKSTGPNGGDGFSVILLPDTNEIRCYAGGKLAVTTTMPTLDTEFFFMWRHSPTGLHYLTINDDPDVNGSGRELPNTSAKVVLGNWYDPAATGRSLYGTLNDIRVYKRFIDSPIDVGDRELIYANKNGNVVVDSDLVAWWKFDEGTPNATATVANSIIDSSGNGYHGTPYGSPVYRAA